MIGAPSNRPSMSGTSQLEPRCRLTGKRKVRTIPATTAPAMDQRAVEAIDGPLAYLSVDKRDCSWIGLPSDAEI